MDMFQMDWWREEVDKMAEGQNQGNIEYITAFYKNISTAIDKIEYDMSVKRNIAQKKLKEAIARGASDNELKQIEKGGEPSKSNVERLEDLKAIMSRFVSLQVESLAEPINERRRAIVGGSLKLSVYTELEQLSKLREELKNSQYYIKTGSNLSSEERKNKEPGFEE